MAQRSNRLLAVTLAQPAAAAETAQEQALVIHDLQETANFALSNGKPGPYRLLLSAKDGRLELAVNDTAGVLLHGFSLSLTPLARVMRDYSQILGSYVQAIKGSTPHAIEAIDMARRAIHNEAAELLQARLSGKVEVDHATARRLFALICTMSAPQDRAPKPPSAPRMVLFICNQNSIRSPMAAAITHYYFGQKIYAASAGLKAGDPDPFVSVVMDESNFDLKFHRPHSVDDDEEAGFDLIITLSPEAQADAPRLPRSKGAVIEHWLLPDPAATQGSREQILDAYRAVRDELVAKIKGRFG